MKLVIFDIETTGLDRVKDQIIQFAAIKVDTETNKVIDSYVTYVRPMGNYSISYSAYFKHGIKPDFLMDKPYLKDIAQNIIDMFEDDNVAILTYNGNSFDIPFLKSELNKYGYDIDFTKRKVYDAFLEEKRRNGISLENTYLRYKGKTMDESGLSAHDALSDVKATYTVFYAQQKINAYESEHIYGEDGIIVDMMFQNELQPCFNIGKYRGLSIKFVKSIDIDYLNWCVSDKCGWMKSTKEYIQNYLK